MIPFYYLLLLHFIGDFVFQSREIAENKSAKFSVMNTHCMTLFTTFLGGLYFLGCDLHKTIGFLICLYCTHFLQDTFVWRSYKWLMMQRYRSELPKFEYWKDSGFWSTIGFDQMMHVATMYYLWRAFL